MTGESFSFPDFTMAQYDLYRLDDRIFWAFVIAGLVFCTLHACRRAFRQPVPTDLPLEETERPKEEETERHILFQRIYHWSNAIAAITLILSGWMIYANRGLFKLEGTPFARFFWHRWGAALLIVSLIFHVVYESFLARGSNPVAVNRVEARRILAILKNFFGLSRSYPFTTKYHPGQIFFHWLVAANLFLLILTGFALWKPFRSLLPLSLFGLGWDFIFYNRLLHGFFTATLIPGIIGHCYFALCIKKNWPETISIFTGRKSTTSLLRKGPWQSPGVRS